MSFSHRLLITSSQYTSVRKVESPESSTSPTVKIKISDAGGGSTQSIASKPEQSQTEKSEEPVAPLVCAEHAISQDGEHSAELSKLSFATGEVESLEESAEPYPMPDTVDPVASGESSHRGIPAKEHGLDIVEAANRETADFPISAPSIDSSTSNDDITVLNRKLVEPPRAMSLQSKGPAKHRNIIAAFIDADWSKDVTKQTYTVEDGKWAPRIPAFHVAIPSFETRLATAGQSEFTVFHILSSIQLPHSEGIACEAEEGDLTEEKPPRFRQIAVDRRYTQFQQLQSILRATFPLISIPDLPGRRIRGNFEPSFLSERRSDLERHLRNLASHPLIRSERAFLEFMGCEDDRVSATVSLRLCGTLLTVCQVIAEYLPKALVQALASDPATFLAQVDPEADHFSETDLLEEAKDLQERLQVHTYAVENGEGIAKLQSSLAATRTHMRGTVVRLVNML